MNVEQMKYEPCKRETTGEEYEAGPDFEGIAERLDLLERLSCDGWWGDAGCWNDEV